MNDFTAYFTYAVHVILKLINVMIHTRSFKSLELKSILCDWFPEILICFVISNLTLIFTLCFSVIMWSLSSNALIILTLTHAPYCKCCRYQFRKLSKIILLQDGNVLCHIEPSCGLGDLLHENSYWEQQQQYFETIPAIKDTTETPFQSESESTKEFNTLFSVTEVPQSNIFIEKITIPESEHDTVTAIYSEKVRASTNKDRPYRLKSRHKAANAKHFRDIKLQERSKKHVRKT